MAVARKRTKLANRWDEYVRCHTCRVSAAHGAWILPCAHGYYYFEVHDLRRFQRKERQKKQELEMLGRMQEQRMQLQRSLIQGPNQKPSLKRTRIDW